MDKNMEEERRAMTGLLSACEAGRDLHLARAEAAEARCAKLEEGIKAVDGLISDSHGVAGLHLNGDIAPWDELRTGGRFEEWLKPFDAALAGVGKEGPRIHEVEICHCAVCTATRAGVKEEPR